MKPLVEYKRTWQTLLALIAFVGIGGVAYMTRLVHAAEHADDQAHHQQTDAAIARLGTIVTTSLLQDQLRRRRQLRDQEQTPFVRDELAQVEVLIDQLQTELKADK